VLDKWWEQLLHNQSALFLKGRLLFRPNTVVTSVPIHLNGRTLLGSEDKPIFNEVEQTAETGRGTEVTRPRG
jgi:hypothetical protein